jgi:hypothetical protein
LNGLSDADNHCHNIVDGYAPIRLLRVGHNTPTALLRQTYFKEAHLRAIFAPFAESVRAIIPTEQVPVPALNIGHVWPQSQTKCGGGGDEQENWLPPGPWETDDYRKRCALVKTSPCLAAIAARLNTTYELFRRCCDPKPFLVQRMRAFMNNHCAVAFFIETHGITSDEELLDRCGGYGSPLWQEIEPNSMRLISEGNLPRALLTLVPYMDLWYKRALTTDQSNEFVHILNKALPQRGQRRVMYSILKNNATADERFLRFISYITLCCLMGTYAEGARSPYSFRTQVLIWRSFVCARRHELVSFIGKKDRDMLFIYALRRFFIYAVEQMPALKGCVRKHYRWDALKCATIRDTTRVCNYLIKDREKLESAATATGSEDDVHNIFWNNVHNYLEKQFSNHKDDSVPIKTRVGSLEAHFSTCAKLLKKKYGINGIGTVSETVWRRVCQCVAKAHPCKGVYEVPFRKLGMSERGVANAHHLASIYNGGAIIKDHKLDIFSPADFEIYHAIICQYKDMRIVNAEWRHSAAVVRAQELAYRYRIRLLDYMPLSETADHVYFCVSCIAFCHTLATSPESTQATGPNNIIHSLSRNLVWCGRKRGNIRCLCPLISVPMKGKIFCIRRKYYSICAACASLHKYDLAVNMWGFPVCGWCDAKTLMERSGVKTLYDNVVREQQQQQQQQ